jgi:hypothetical protein
MLLGAVALSGCTKPDWIQQTLVTVDVTGVWVGRGGNATLTLEQQGPKVTGSVNALAGYLGRLSGKIEGSVTGDVLQFKQTSGTDPRIEGELSVSGDEMTGRWMVGNFRSTALFQRVSSSPRPASQP